MRKNTLILPTAFSNLTGIQSSYDAGKSVCCLYDHWTLNYSTVPVYLLNFCTSIVETSVKFVVSNLLIIISRQEEFL